MKQDEIPEDTDGDIHCKESNVYPSLVRTWGGGRRCRYRIPGFRHPVKASATIRPPVITNHPRTRRGCFLPGIIATWNAHIETAKIKGYVTKSNMGQLQNNFQRKPNYQSSGHDKKSKSFYTDPTYLQRPHDPVQFRTSVTSTFLFSCFLIDFDTFHPLRRWM